MVKKVEYWKTKDDRLFKNKEEAEWEEMKGELINGFRDFFNARTGDRCTLPTWSFAEVCAENVKELHELIHKLLNTPSETPINFEIIPWEEGESLEFP